MGADDYITKPFSQRILIERIKVVLRRYDISEEYETHYKNKKVVRGSLSLDPVKHICKWNGDPVNLTVSEFSILNALAKFPGHVKTREQLLDIIYDDNIYVEDRNIDSHIKRIRKKFLMVDRSFRNIETVYGLGYRYRSI
jgi:two-component system response regulator ChvI